MIYGAVFERYPNLHVESGWRTTVGESVVQEESVTGWEGHERHVAIYLVIDDAIVRERLIA